MRAVVAPRAAGGGQRRVRRARTALVRDADQQAGRRRVERQLERLGRVRCRAAQPRAPDGLAQDLGRRLRAVLGGPAARHVDRLAGRRRRAHGRGERRGLAVGAGLAGRDPAGEARFRLDHLGHVVRRAGTRARRAGEGPRVGRAGEGSGRVEGGVSAHRPRIGAPAPPRTSGPLGATRPRGSPGSPRPGRREPPPRVTMAPDTGPRRRERMQVGLMVPQGWKGEFDGWPADRAWARSLELDGAGRGARRRIALGLRPLPYGPGPDGRDHLRVVLDARGARDGDDARPPRPHGRVHGVPQPGPHGQADLDARRHQRRPVRARDRGRLEGRRMEGLRLRLPDDR